MKPRPLSRRARFIDLGGDAFMPQQRMREIRWEEAVIRARVKRAVSEVPWSLIRKRPHCRPSPWPDTVL